MESIQQIENPEQFLEALEDEGFQVLESDERGAKICRNNSEMRVNYPTEELLEDLRKLHVANGWEMLLDMVVSEFINHENEEQEHEQEQDV